MRTHFRLESVVQRLSGTGFLHTGNNAAAAVYLGVENSKGDDAATVAEVDRNLAAAGPLNVVDVLGAVGEFAAADGVLLRDRPLCYRLSGSSGTGKRRANGTIGATGNPGKDG